MLKRIEVQEAVKAHQEKVRAAAEVSEQAVLRELGRLAMFDIKGLYNPDTGELKVVHEIEDDTRRAIVSVKHTTRGSGERKESSVEFKAADKLQALIGLGKHYGSFEGRQPTTGNERRRADSRLDRPR